MNLERLYYQIIAPNRKIYWQPIFFVFQFSSWLFCLILGVRDWGYRSGFLPVKRLKSRVISVGNITLGGNGKTPLVLWIAKTLAAKGKRPVVISRGYRGNTSEEAQIVSDGERILMGTRTAGDEPVMIARRLPKIPVIVSKKRYAGGLLAQDRFNADTIILDDGFQHRALHRDCNILMLNSSNPFGTGRLFPSGNLREPAEGVRRANMVCWIDNSEVPSGSDQHSQISGDFPKIRSQLVFDQWMGLDGKERRPPEFLKGKKISAFCSIAGPERFKNTLQALGVEIVHFSEFPDHHWFSDNDCRFIEQQAKQANVDCIITTEKDSVKIDHYPWSQKVWMACMEIEIREGANSLIQEIFSDLNL